MISIDKKRKKPLNEKRTSRSRCLCENEQREDMLDQINSQPVARNFRFYPVKTVRRVATAKLPTKFGEFFITGYRSLTSDEEFVVLHKGDLKSNAPALVRIHSQCLTGDVLGSLKCDCGEQLQKAISLIEAEGRGAVVYQLQEGRGIGIINKIRAYELQDKGADTIEANERLGFAADAREYEQCAEILKDLGLRRIKVMSNNPDKIKALQFAGLEIVERVPLEILPSPEKLNYLQVKKKQMGHLLELVN